MSGSSYGPAPGPWFPRERGSDRDLLRLLNDITAPKYEAEHKLTGIMLQSWDSVSPERRAGQFTLGDSRLPGQPQVQVDAATDALRTLNEWLLTRSGG